MFHPLLRLHAAGYGDDGRTKNSYSFQIVHTNKSVDGRFSQASIIKLEPSKNLTRFWIYTPEYRQTFRKNKLSTKIIRKLSSALGINQYLP